MPNSFDFSKFLQDATNIDPSTKQKLLEEGVQDEMGAAMSEVAPRLWAVLQNEMSRNADNKLYLSAVVNAAIFSLLSWTVACIPEGETNGKSHDALLREQMIGNLELALIVGRSQAEQMTSFALNVGQLKLMEDAVKGIATVLTQNSMIIKGIHSYIEEERKR